MENYISAAVMGKLEYFKLSFCYSWVKWCQVVKSSDVAKLPGSNPLLCHLPVLALGKLFNLSMPQYFYNSKMGIVIYLIRWW